MSIALGVPFEELRLRGCCRDVATSTASLLRVCLGFADYTTHPAPCWIGAPATALPPCDGDPCGTMRGGVTADESAGPRLPCPFASRSRFPSARLPSLRPYAACAASVRCNRLPRGTRSDDRATIVTRRLATTRHFLGWSVLPWVSSTLRRHHVCPATRTGLTCLGFAAPPPFRTASGLCSKHTLAALFHAAATHGFRFACCNRRVRGFLRATWPVSACAPSSRISPFEPRNSHADTRGGCFSSHGLDGSPPFPSGAANGAFESGLARTRLSPSATEVARPKSMMVPSRPSARIAPLGRADVPTCSTKFQRTRRLACLFRELPPSVRFVSFRASRLPGNAR